MHLHNADVVRKFIFRYLSVPFTDGYWNIFMDFTNKDILNYSSLRVVDELNKFWFIRIKVDVKIMFSNPPISPFKKVRNKHLVILVMNLPAAETAGYLKEIVLCHSLLSGILQKDSGQARMTDTRTPHSRD